MCRSGFKASSAFEVLWKCYLTFRLVIKMPCRFIYIYIYIKLERLENINQARSIYYQSTIWIPVLQSINYLNKNEVIQCLKKVAIKAKWKLKIFLFYLFFSLSISLELKVCIVKWLIVTLYEFHISCLCINIIIIIK